MKIETCPALSVQYIDSDQTRPFVVIRTKKDVLLSMLRIFNLAGDEFPAFVRLVELWSVFDKVKARWVSKALPNPSLAALRLSWGISTAETEVLKEVRDAINGIIVGQVAASMVSAVDVYPRQRYSGLKIERPAMLVSGDFGTPAAFSDGVDFVKGTENLREAKWRDCVVIDNSEQDSWEAERMKEHVTAAADVVLKMTNTVADELAKFRDGDRIRGFGETRRKPRLTVVHGAEG